MKNFIAVLEGRDEKEAKNVEDGHGNIGPELILTCYKSLSTIAMMLFRQVYLTPLILNPAAISVLCNFADIYFSFQYLTFEIFGLDKLVLYLLFQAFLQFFVETAAYFLILLLDSSD